MTELQSSPRNKKNGSSLRKGESLRSNGGYEYRWTDANGKRHSVYASTLDELRAKEESITKENDREKI